MPAKDGVFLLFLLELAQRADADVEKVAVNKDAGGL